MIELDEQFTIKWDGYQWHLLEYRMDTKKDTRASTPRTTYHPNIGAILGTIFERIVGEAEGGLSDLQEKIAAAKVMVDAFGIDLTPPIAVVNPPILNNSELEEHY